MGTALVIIVIAFLIFIFVWTPIRVRQRSRQTPESLDLTSVRDAVMEKHGWSLARANAALLEYIRFLTLLQKKPGFMLVPWNDAEGRDDLDQFWHQHILDTAKYSSDCQTLFGKIIHHNPHVVRGSEQENESVEKTRRLYARTFQSGPYGSSADVALFSGCSTCGAETSSHAHAGHDGGHGHSDGGGHSCGGHGCGHGCGGH